MNLNELPRKMMILRSNEEIGSNFGEENYSFVQRWGSAQRWWSLEKMTKISDL